MNQMTKLNGALCPHSSPNPPERPSNQPLLVLLALSVTLVAGYTVNSGGTFIADLTSCGFHMEATGRPK